MPVSAEPVLDRSITPMTPTAIMAPTAATTRAAPASTARTGRARARRNPVTVEGPAPSRRATAATRTPPVGTAAVSRSTSAAGWCPARQAGTMTPRARIASTRTRAASSGPVANCALGRSPRPSMPTCTMGASSDPARRADRKVLGQGGRGELAGAVADRFEQPEGAAAGDQPGAGGAGHHQAGNRDQEHAEPARQRADQLRTFQDLLAGVGPRAGVAEPVGVGGQQAALHRPGGGRVAQPQRGDVLRGRAPGDVDYRVR